MSKLEQVLVHQTNTHRTLYADTLIYKRVEGARPYLEVLSVSLIGYSADIRDITKKDAQISISHQKGRSRDTFYIKNRDEYEEIEIKSGDFTKIIFSRKTGGMITQLSEEEKKEREEKGITTAYPLLFVAEENKKEQITTVYNMVKNGITTPMFPNVEEHLVLAGQMFIDKKEAKKLLNVIRGSKVEMVDMKELHRAKFLLRMLQEWKVYVFNEMVRRHLIRPVQVRFAPENVSVHEVIVEEEVLEKIIQEGVRKRHIFFTQRFVPTDKLDGFNDFMSVFANPMAKRIDALAKPHHRKGDIREEVAYWFRFLETAPLEAQKDTIEASLKSLDLKGKVNVVGECGVGKTLVMLSTQWILSKIKGFPMKLLVFCPDTLVDTVWREEVVSTLKDTHVHTITSIADLEAFDQKGWLDDEEDRVFILSQQVGKTGYTLKPAVNWKTILLKEKDSDDIIGHTKGFSCPCCGEVVQETVRIQDSGVVEYVKQPVSFTHFRTLRYNNYKCKACEAVLWEPHNKDAKRETFVYEPELRGYFPRDAKAVRRHLEELVYQQGKKFGRERAKIGREMEKYRALEQIIEGVRPVGKRVAPKKVSVAEYIFKKMRNRFTSLIIDEFHEFQGDSSRSDACVQLINAVPYIQTGTGTGMNGYAYSRFKTDYMMYPEKLKKAGFKIGDREKYQATFGVTERRYRLSRKDGTTKKTTLSPVAKPGISPVIFPLFMQDTTVFLSLEDLKDDLPALRHYQIEVEMDPALQEAKEQLEQEIRSIARYDKKLFRGSVQVGYSFLDSPTIEKSLTDRYTGEVVLKTPVIHPGLDHKMQKLRELAKSEIIHEKNRMMVYTYFTGDNINGYIHDQLQKDGYKITVLNKQEDMSISCDGSTRKVKKIDREKFIRQEVEKGTEILIVNPELIKTGYNLTAFPTICYYQMGYQVYTNRQADRRSWRLGQTKDCKIIYLYYKDTIQQDVASLMATKIVASQAIEGRMDAAGLEAICNDRTAEEELAQRFFEGYRGKVELKKYSKETA